ncbi:amidohydrolase family protein [Thermococcus waiotapuensis]|uniref:Amidohydrolase n=1 Tax=Thermococcus waiotapuensis TaxID=90909 RepID=A0AAE4NWA8_9EURY|nr:amidohydrolase [Thermococcus waiotapuensis]MDV3104329.1 amidohydrolase [Thermococcus waiotapuensis]
MLALVGTVVDAEKVLPDHAVLVEGNKIAGVVPAERVGEDVERVYGGRGFFVMPGLINAHTHVAMARFRGLGESMPTQEWLEKIIWPMEREWTREEIRNWALLGMAEALANGSTTINDHYFFAEEIAQTAEKIGIRAFVGHTVMDLVDFPHAAPEEGFRFFRRWHGRSDLVVPTLAPHATNTVSLELMSEISGVSEEKDGRVHIHLAQSRGEVRELRRRYNLKPVEFLHRAGALNGRLIGVHGVYLSENEMKALSSSGSTLVHCPSSNVELEAKTVNLLQLVELGLNVALGTDSPNPVGSIDMFAEIRCTALFSNLMSRKPHSISAREVLGLATVNGARALGIAAGLIRPGYLADLLLINGRKPWFTPPENPYSNLIHSARGSDVEAVLVNGEVVYERGYFVRLGKRLEELLP